uniref:Apoptosis-stimulating of p53 protein 2-like RA domain-containing protein n=1 Tax=Cyprinodon variegatus TaxID=28743 RepID=A0A3Q2DFU5_CYPVA
MLPYRNLMFLNVHRGSNDTEDPFIPGMLCKDVVKLGEEPCETDCCLAGEWRGSGDFINRASVTLQKNVNVNKSFFLKISDLLLNR